MDGLQYDDDLMLDARTNTTSNTYFNRSWEQVFSHNQLLKHSMRRNDGKKTLWRYRYKMKQMEFKS